MEHDAKNIIHVSHLKKSFKRLEVLKDINVDVREGEVQLTNMWFELKARIEKGDASEENVAWARENLKPPKHLDFRMN